MNTNDNLQIFARLTKIDEATRRVWGRATQEIPDRSGEIMDYEASKPNFVKWSGDMAKASDGANVGNVRAMHGKVAAGKLTEIEFNDLEKAIDVCAEVVDDGEWQKCLKGVYTGFSVGGAYGKKWTDKENPLLKRYEARPTEVSLVDLPCVPTAAFTLVKADGASVEMHFEQPDPEKLAVGELAKVLDSGAIKPSEVLELLRKRDEEAAAAAQVAKLDELKKAVADEVLGDLTIGSVETLAKAHLPADALAALPADGAQRMGAAIDALRKAAGFGELDLEKRDFTQGERDKAAKEGDALPDGSFPIKTKADLGNAVKLYGRAKDPEKAKAHIEARAKDLGATGELPDSWEKACAPCDLLKSMYTVAELADVVTRLDNVQTQTEWEASIEGDGSPLPARLAAAVAEVGEILCEMVEEETQELATDTTATDAMAEKMAKVATARELLKVGKRNSTADQARLQGIHDHSVKMGAVCDSEAEKAARGGALAKAFGLTDEAEALAKFDEMQKAANNWLNQPALPRGALRAVPKGEDARVVVLEKSADEKARDDEQKRAEESGDPLALMKMAFQRGVVPGDPTALRK